MRPAPLFRSILAALALGVVPPLARAEGAAPAAAETPQQKASLQALDRALARFEALLAQDDDPPHQAATRAVLDGLKKRRDALPGAFDQAKCDDLRTELELEIHRLGAWLAPHPAAP